ncbi:uncharacterized protein [Palaemon carinicauda]|uniref:uncharacterized protein isoform X3 n=1 Tax=Palaemon carinicauda TaxID=392227 RepID=UPI0035B588C0
MELCHINLRPRRRKLRSLMSIDLLLGRFQKYNSCWETILRMSTMTALMNKLSSEKQAAEGNAAWIHKAIDTLHFWDSY